MSIAAIIECILNFLRNAIFLKANSSSQWKLNIGRNVLMMLVLYKLYSHD